MDEKKVQEVLSEYRAAMDKAEELRELAFAVCGEVVNEDLAHGSIGELAKDAGISREMLRRLRKLGYYRSITRYGSRGEAWITAPLDTIRTDVDYDIRAPKRGEVVGHITGRDLYSLCRSQQAAYIAEDPKNRTRLRLVDVSSYIDIDNRKQSENFQLGD